MSQLNAPRSDAGAELADRLQWAVSDEALLLRSLAHRSWCAENAGTESNERLEFLGDAVLGLVVTDHLFRTYPTLPEGELAKVRASVVNASVLAELATELRVGDALLLGKGEGQSGGRGKPSILADAMEALIGAVYIDQGWSAAAGLVMRLLSERMAEASAGPGGQDYKTRLQELCARQLDELPVYHVADEGPDHAKVFDAVVVVGGEARGHGHGRSKKQAEQAAARVAWEALRAELGRQPLVVPDSASDGHAGRADRSEPVDPPRPAEPAGGGPAEPAGGGPAEPTGSGPVEPVGGGPAEPAGGGPAEPTGGGPAEPTGGGPAELVGGGLAEPTASGPTE